MKFAAIIAITAAVRLEEDFGLGAAEALRRHNQRIAEGKPVYVP